MFCSNCGKQLDENAKFCDGCGAQQGAGNDINSASNQQAPNSNPNVNANYQTSHTEPTPQAKKVSKKTTNIIIAAAIVLVAFLIGKFAIAPSMSSGGGENTGGQSTSNTNSTYSSSNAISNSAYDDILTEAYIVHFQPMFNMDSASFVSKLSDGSIVCADYGYEGDQIIQWVETLYIPVTNYTDSQKTEAENNVRNNYAKLEALSCCNVKYKMGTNYLTVTVEFSDVDKAENYSALYQVGILTTNGPISMSATESGLIAQGAVKK